MEAQYPAMAKRSRGTVRPGQRRPIDRRPASATASSDAAPRAIGLTEAEAARAAELEAAMLAEERAADAARKRTQARAGRDVSVGAGSLAVRAQEEYSYVGRDVREIARIALILFTILIVLWILVDVTKVIPIL